MGIGLAAERVAESLVNDEWFWHYDLDNPCVVRRGMTLSVGLNGEVKVGPGTSLPGGRVPMNWSERRMLARAAKACLERIIATIANSPAPQHKEADGK